MNPVLLSTDISSGYTNSMLCYVCYIKLVLEKKPIETTPGNIYLGLWGNYPCYMNHVGTEMMVNISSYPAFTFWGPSQVYMCSPDM